MASSNRHWPSMFKSKPTNHSNSSYSSGPADAERTPEPKPRWNPRPEQIRILESIFNSGMVNPPRDEIRKIRARLSEYGQLGDANVFYWFQNRKSRSKNKQRHHKPTPTRANSDKSSQNALNTSTLMDLLSSPTNSVNQSFFQSSQLFSEPLISQGFSFSADLCVGDHQECVGNCSSTVLVGDDYCDHLMMMNRGPLRLKDHDQVVKLPPPQQIVTTTTSQPVLPAPDLGGPAPQKTTVFINDVCYTVTTAPFNVKEAFGDEAVLIQPSGLPVVTDESGFTQQPLLHGGVYYLVNQHFEPE